VGRDPPLFPASLGLRKHVKVEDLRPRGAGWTARLHEKGGKQHSMPCHHALAEVLRAYIDAAGIVTDRKGWLFRRVSHSGSTSSIAPLWLDYTSATGSFSRRLKAMP
jgi:integrase